VIIDAHIHVGAWAHADFLGRSSDVAGTLAMLHAAGIDGAALMPSDRCENRALRDELLRVVEAGSFAGPLWMHAWVRPGVDEDLAFVRAHRRDLTGLKLHPSLARAPIDGEAFRPILDLAAAHGLLVLVHCGRWAEIAGYAHALAAAARYPSVRFLLAHAGGDTPPNAAGAARAVAEQGLPNVSFEISGLREYWVIERNLALLGAGRYLLGSDYPLAHPLMYIGAVRGMAIGEAERARILGENAVALLGPPLTPARGP
jgi:predicted TIM-barrel fold metal-dependent hydrolase